MEEKNLKNVICFDVGGTSIKYAVINSEGDILFKSRFPTPDNNCSKTIPENMIIKINELRKKFEIHSVGICTAGLIDSENGVVISANNFPGYSGTRLAESIKEKTGLNTFVENDVNAAALGEMWKGAAKGNKTFVCIALGTGVGSAIVIDGKVVKGVSGAAGEIGHIIINENGERCSCGTVGCYERYASTGAFIREYSRKTLEQGLEVENIDGEEIMKRVQNGESLANEVFEEFLNHIVTGIVSITHLLDPGLIVVGGGISAQGEEFFKKLNEKFKKRAIKNYAEHTFIVQAQLKNDAGMYGACFVAL
jgi:glucokinase